MDTETCTAWADLLKAIGHPVRLLILSQMRRGPKCVKLMREILDVPQPNVSQHLTVLRHAGLVAFIQDGGRRCYYLARPALVEALMTFIEGDYPNAKLTQEEVRARMGETAASA